MNGFEKRKERKKESIRRAALQLFMEYGLRKVNIGEIAQQAGVSQVTIYNYFGSKDDLIHQVLEHYLEEQMAEFTRFYESPQPYIEKLEWVLFKKAKVFDTMNVEFLDTFISSEPGIANLIQQYEEKTAPLFANFIEQGKREGYFHQQLSLETILFYMNLFSQQALKQLEQMPEGESRQRVYKELFSVFFYGVTGQRSQGLQERYDEAGEITINPE